MLTKGSKQALKNFDAAVRLRKQYIIKLLTQYSKVYTKNGIPYTNRARAVNAMHHNVMNNITKPKSQYWKKRKGRWECEGCAIKLKKVR